MRADKGGDRLTMALKAEAGSQFIGHQLKIGRLLQWDKLFEELAGFRWPIWPVVAARELGAERRTVLEPVRAQAVKMRLADLEVVGRFGAINQTVVKLLEYELEKWSGQAFGQLFFSQSRMNRRCPLVEGLRRPSLRSGRLNPSTKGQFLWAKTVSLFELPPFSFCSRPDTILISRLITKTSLPPEKSPPQTELKQGAEGPDGGP